MLPAPLNRRYGKARSYTNTLHTGNFYLIILVVQGIIVFFFYCL